MKNSALVVIDLQNYITKNYKKIIAKVNEAIDWAEQKELWIVYIQHNNLSAGTRTFKHGTRGAELVPELLTYYEKQGLRGLRAFRGRAGVKATGHRSGKKVMIYEMVDPRCWHANSPFRRFLFDCLWLKMLCWQLRSNA